MNILKETNFTNIGEKKVGKVRDIYIQPDKIILVSTDRHSSFDRIIAHIPHKGQVLNQISAFWFDKTKDIVQNHVLEVPDPNVLVAKKCKPLPIEVTLSGMVIVIKAEHSLKQLIPSEVTPSGIIIVSKVEHPSKHIHSTDVYSFGI